MTILPPTDIECMLRLTVAVICGAAIGFERDRRGMPTGSRTLALVCLGACAAVIAALKAGDSDGFSRVAQGVVTGIGFLGGGVILQSDSMKTIKGLTTAASIWLTAAIGLLAGTGDVELAGFVTVLALLVLFADSMTQSIWPKVDEKPKPPAEAPPST